MTFSASIFASFFSSIFNGKWFPKRCHFILTRWPFWLPFRDLFRRSIFRCILVALWLPFGSLLPPFGSLLLPFGSLLAPSGTLWATLWLQLAHFWRPLAHFCCLWRSIFSLLTPPRGILAYLCTNSQGIQVKAFFP